MREGLETLEMLEHTRSMDAADLQLFFSKNFSEVHSFRKLSSSLEIDFSIIQSFCTDMESLSPSIEDKHVQWKRKLEQVLKEAEFLKERLDKYNLRTQDWIRAARDKAELLGLGRVNNGEPARATRIFNKEAGSNSLFSSFRFLSAEDCGGKCDLQRLSEQREHRARDQQTALAVRIRQIMVFGTVLIISVLFWTWMQK